MGVQVDEARRHDQAAGVDRLVGLARADMADLGNPAVLDADVAPEARQPTAVDDHSPLDDAIIAGHVSSVSPSLSVTRDSVNAPR